MRVYQKNGAMILLAGLVCSLSSFASSDKISMGHETLANYDLPHGGSKGGLALTGQLVLERRPEVAAFKKIVEINGAFGEIGNPEGFKSVGYLKVDLPIYVFERELVPHSQAWLSLDIFPLEVTTQNDRMDAGGIAANIRYDVGLMEYQLQFTLRAPGRQLDRTNDDTQLLRPVSGGVHASLYLDDEGLAVIHAELDAALLARNGAGRDLKGSFGLKQYFLIPGVDHGYWYLLARCEVETTKYEDDLGKEAGATGLTFFSGAGVSF